MKQDKIKHFAWGLVIAAIMGASCYFGSYNEPTETYSLFSGVCGCLCGVVAGGVKEWADLKYSGKWDWMDFLWTCLGVALVVLVMLGVHYGKG